MPDTAHAIPAADRVVTTSDNMPPRERDTERVKELVVAVNAWAQGRRIRNEEEAGKFGDLRDQIRKERKAIDEHRKAEKKPHDDAGAEVQLFFNPLLDTLDATNTVLDPVERGWLRLKQLQIDEERRLAEEALAKAKAEAEALAEAATVTDEGDAVERQLAAQKAQEQAAEAAAAAQQAAAAKPRIVSETTGRARGYRTRWYAEITDWRKAAAALSEHPWVKDAVQRAANAAAVSMKSAAKIDGADIKSRQEV